MWYRKTARGLELQPHFFLKNAKTVKIPWNNTIKKARPIAAGLVLTTLPDLRAVTTELYKFKFSYGGGKNLLRICFYFRCGACVFDFV